MLATLAAGELALEAVVNHWLTTANDGKSYRLSYYNLEASLDAFLQCNEREVLPDVGEISQLTALIEASKTLPQQAAAEPTQRKKKK